MSLLTEYQGIRQRMDAVIDSQGLDALAEGLEKMIAQSAEYVVYSYQASPKAMAKRRYGIGNKANLNEIKSHFSLSIENNAIMQSGEDDESTMVSQGWKSYRQPYPRPFMEEALEAYTNDGMATGSYADKDLIATLQANGF